MFNLKKHKPFAMLGLVLFAAALFAFVMLSACTSAAPRWTAADVRPLEDAPVQTLARSETAEQQAPAAPAAPAAVAFAYEAEKPPPSVLPDAEFASDFVPERDVAAAEIQRRIADLERELEGLTATLGTMRAGTAAPPPALAIARDRLELARGASARLAVAPFAEWQHARELANASVAALEQSMAVLRAQSASRRAP